jgi:phosphoribosylformylglycinamidine (FGAM) synthase PurS component
VWQDARGGDNCTDVYGARVTPGGTVLDPSGILITMAGRDQLTPAVGFDGANFLVAWGDNRAADLNLDVYGARVTPAGTVLDPQGFVITQAANEQSHPAIGFDGANFLVVWTDYRNGDYSDIYGARVTPQRTVLDPQGFAISQTVLDQSNPVLGFDGANFLLAWTDYRSGIYSDIFGARVTPQGTVLDTSGLIIMRAAEGQYSPALSIGFDGTNYLVVWEDYRSDQPDIFGALVTPAGVAIDTGPVVRQEGNQLHPALARGSGSELFLVYQGWVGTLGDKLYNTDRTWGKFNPVPGSIEETPNAEVRTPNRGATIVRGVLFMPEASSRKPQATSLLDVSGRRVLDLHPGANDVSRLSPGVYFVRSEPSAVSRHPLAVTKVVVTR